MKRRAYATSHYQKARRRLLGQPCWSCGQPATTADHYPALALHHHVEGSGCCVLLAACGPCNYAGGARVAALLRRTRARVRQHLVEVEASRSW